MTLVTNWLGNILLLLGSGFCLVGALGLLRMPNFIQRVHAASLIDSLGLLLILSGLAFHAGWSSLTLKLALIVFFMIITGPTAVHAITNISVQRRREEELGE